MDFLEQKIPELRSSSNINEIPWLDAVVWSDSPRTEGRVYEWINKEHIKYVSWTNGIVSVTPAYKSALSDSCQCIIISGSFIWIGKNVVVG